MPFIAICPHCRVCRLRAPLAKRGKKVRCPKCHEPFPLIPHDAGASEDPNDEAVDSRVPSPSSLPVSTPPSDSEIASEELLPLARIALGLVAFVLVLSQLPYGRPAALLIAVLGACGAGFAMLELRKRRALLCWSGLLLNGFLAVLLAAYPATLGLTGWWSESRLSKSESVEVPHGEWIDAGDAAWQQGGVRVGVTFATIGGDPRSGAASEGRERYLWVGLRITNVGVGADLNFSGWRDKGTEAPSLSTADESILTLRQYVGTTGKTTIQPGQYLECMLAFEIPAPGQDLLLTLPTQPFGDTSVIRFRIPHLLIGRL